MKMNFKGAIFDMDGTLLDTLEDIKVCGNRVLETYGEKPFSKREYAYFVGNGLDKLAHNMLKNAKHDIGYREFLHELAKEYERNNNCFAVPYPQSVKILKKLSDNGIRLAILSNKKHEWVNNLAEHFFPDIKFTHIMGQRDGIAKKPDPGIALEISNDWGFSPKECLFFGDSFIDMLTASNAGMFPIGVLWGFRDRSELERYGAKLIINSYEDFLDYFWSKIY